MYSIKCRPYIIQKNITASLKNKFENFCQHEDFSFLEFTCEVILSSHFYIYWCYIKAPTIAITDVQFCS